MLNACRIPGIHIFMQTCESREPRHLKRMPGRTRRFMPRCVLALWMVLCMQCSGAVPGSSAHQLESGGRVRTYWLHIPPHLPADQPAALVLIFHGSGSDGQTMEDFTKFSALADQHGFIAVYPDAVAENWNDGRAAASILSQEKNIDDVAFTSAVIDAVAHEHPLDAKRIFATGFSNGGIFVHLLAEKLATRLAAIASVSGGIAEPIAATFKPAVPVSVFIIHGTKDPMVPYKGGNVDESDNGRIISTEQTVNKWIAINGNDDTEITGTLPDIDPADESQVKWARWTFRKSKTEILLYTIVGAGHTWPDGPQFLPVATIGEVDRDFDGTTAIWDFFQKHPRP
jgi:polyhydroxybutyrate depolymerase